MASEGATPIVTGGEGETKPMTEKELKKKAAQQAKLEKFKAKQAKMEQMKKDKASAPEAAGSKKKEKPEKDKKNYKYEINTAPGDKKDTTCPLPDAYSPQYVEAAWYSWWEKERFFKPEYKGEGEPSGQFMMVIPPPNVTGSLHLGHALTFSLEDAITRWHRMNGRTALWVPGTDHAGIATQVVVEKKLMRDRQLSRHDLGREKFIEEVWKWKNVKGDRIYHQMRKMGNSVDWERACFTMDPKLVRAVSEAFIQLHDKGLIFRSNRLVNWSCSLNSAISEIEVDKKELQGRTLLAVPGYEQKVEFGVIVSFAYKLEGSDDEIVVATTRIETMLGDSAVAIHPDDPRYKNFHGKFVMHPFVKRRMPIVCDSIAVDMSFGTGAVKITPAHDHNDFEVGKRHGLPFINIFNTSGAVTGDCGAFTGMKRFDARLAVLEHLKKIGLYRGTEENPMVVPMCSRSKDIIEPLLKPQWYVNIDNMAAKAVEVVKTGKLKIVPKVFEKTWYSWLENPRDWCISRQLWWGHRIPAYQVQLLGEAAGREGSESDIWVTGRTEEEAMTKAVAKFGVAKENIKLEQDPDVLDTWFSSGLFPFSIFGWPDNTADLKQFYPGTLLETGRDILFFWVARMVMMGQELMGELPFTEVYLHSMVRDAHGRKMSKTLGNVVDPIDVIHGISLEGLHKTLEGGNLDVKEIERAKLGQKQDYPQGIPECGTDALRFGLCASNLQGADVNLDIMRVQGYRFFCNKLWNATKFAMMALGSDYSPPATPELTGSERNIDRWILSRLAYAVSQCQKGFEAYDFPMATTASYNFWLYELCDLYLEYMKPIMKGSDEKAKLATQNVLYTCLDMGLRIIHPFMPFLSEELFQRLPRRPGKAPPSICVASYPTLDKLPFAQDEDLEKEVDFAYSTIKCIRSMKADYQLTNKSKVEVTLKVDSQSLSDTVSHYNLFISTMTNASSLNVTCQGTAPLGCAIATVTNIGNVALILEVHLLLKGIIDIPKELTRLESKRSTVSERISKLEEAMTKKDYEKVPEDVRTQNKERLEQSSKELENVAAAVEKLKLMEETS